VSSASCKGEANLTDVIEAGQTFNKAATQRLGLRGRLHCPAGRAAAASRDFSQALWEIAFGQNSVPACAYKDRLVNTGVKCAN